MLEALLGVMFAGAFGCAARMWLSSFLARKYGASFPIGTLVVNILGCFIIGAFAGIARPDGGLWIHPLVRQAVMVGFLGGFTTFSSFSLQTIALFGDGEWGFGVLNIALSIVLCLLAVWLGHLAALQVISG
jgi:CrcB protein